MNSNIQKSVYSYNKAFKFFKEINTEWDTLLDRETISSYEYLDLLDKIDDFEKHLNRVEIGDIKEYLEDKEELDKLDDVKFNLHLFRDAADTISKDILKRSYYEELKNIIPKFIAQIYKKDPSLFKKFGSAEEAGKKFINVILHPSKIKRLKSQIEAIIRGSMTLPYFKRIFQTLVRNSKEVAKIKKPEVSHPTPPEMWSEEKKKEWEEMIKKRKEEAEEERKKEAGVKGISKKAPEEFKKGNKNYIKIPDGKELQYDFVTKDMGGVVKYLMNDKVIYTYLSEGFISINLYKKLMLV